MKNKIISVGVYLLAAVLYIVGPKSIFRVCEVGEKPMKCYWSTQSLIGIAIILLGIAVVYALTKTKREKLLISAISIVTNIIAILIPSVLIGGCKMKTMACQSTTFPAVYVIGAVAILISIANIFYLLKTNKEVSNEG